MEQELGVGIRGEHTALKTVGFPVLLLLLLLLL
jgi:hypothetical protein